MTTQTAQKAVVICADDFGAGAAIDEGILRLAEAGRLNATSCLSLASGFQKRAGALLHSHLHTGVHINFTESFGHSGFYLPLGRLMRKAFLRQLDTQVLTDQIRQQLDAFEDQMGRAPDFIDGHQHVHQFPQIRDALLAELKHRYSSVKPWLRFTWPARQQAIPLAQALKAHIIGLLGARKLGAMARAGNFRCNARFAGVYNFQGGQEAYSQLLHAWLANMGDGDVLMCHPAAFLDPADGLGRQRQAEYAVLAGSQTGQWLKQNSLYLYPRSCARNTP